VHNILSDGLYLHGIVCDSAERNESRNSRPGVVVVRFKNVDDNRKVMSKKRDLKNSRQYTSVFIEHDLSYADRIMSNNFRTLLRSILRTSIYPSGGRESYLEKTLEAVASVTTAPHSLGRAVLTVCRWQTETAKAYVTTVALPVSMTYEAAVKARAGAAAAIVFAAIAVVARGTAADRVVVVAVRGTVDPAGATATTNVITTGETTPTTRFPLGFGTFVDGINTVTQTILFYDHRVFLIKT